MKSLLSKLQHEIKVIQGEASQNMTYESQRTFSSEDAARQAFNQAVDRLFHVDAWSGLSTFAANFSLHDAGGQPKPNGSPAVGDYILIRLPGPLPENWVQVVDRRTDEQRAAFTVRPSPNPRQGDGQTIEHFFDRQASSTFQVVRDGHTLTAAEIGRNEAINQNEPQAGNRAVVNGLIAETGWLFYQQMQWKLLTDYLVDC